MQYRGKSGFAILLSASLLLSACGSDDSSTAGNTPTSVSTTVSGVAATGAPIAGGSIVLHCQNSWNEGTTTNSNGEWSIVVPSANLPCAIKASASGGGQNYYSFTTGSGSSIVSNVTPLTSLALAKAGITPGDAWFNALNDAGLQSLASSLATAITALQTALQTAGYTLPSGFNPFSVAFTAAAGNDYDDLLEALKAALDTASSDFATLLTNFASGGSLPDAPDEEPEEPGSSCTGGDDKLVFTSGPSDFCGFSKGASANTIDNYYQFTSTAGSHGTVYVKFNMNADGSTVHDVTIENDDYAFACGVGALPACTGVTFSSGSTYKQFTLNATQLSVIYGASEAITVSGLLIHSTSSSGTGGSDTIATPTLEAGEFGVRFASNGTIQGTPESGVERFYSYTGNGEVIPGSGDSAGLLSDAYLTVSSPYSSFGLTSLPNTVGTYSCGDNYGAFNGRNIQMAYAVGQGYSSMGTGSVSGFSCSITVTHVGTISGSAYTGYVEGTFKARLFKTGAPVSLATSIVISGTFRFGQ